MFKPIKRCFICDKFIGNRKPIYHINIYNEVPIKFFCTIDCKDKYLSTVRKKRKFTNLFDWFKVH